MLDEAARNGAKLELTKLIDVYYSEVQAMGGRRWDTSSLIARLETKRRAEAATRIQILSV